VPKLWSDTIETHRREVRDAIVDTTAALVARHGLRAVTMSQIAEGTGIGRATLYKYFPDVEAILVAWHERHVAGHLARLVQLRDGAADPGAALEAVLGAYASIAHQVARQDHGAHLTALLHGGGRVSGAQAKLVALVSDLLIQGATTGHVRDDVPPQELAAYCLGALTAAGGLPSEVAVARLVSVTLAGLRRPQGALLDGA